MCLICLEFDKKRMTWQEARRALGEMASGMDPTHVKEIREKLEKARDEEQDENTPQGKAP